MASSRAPAGRRSQQGRVLQQSIVRPAAPAFRRVVARAKYRYDERSAVDSEHHHSHEEAPRFLAFFRGTKVGQPGLRISKQQPFDVYRAPPPPHSTSLTCKQAPSKQSLLRPWTETVVTLPPRITALDAARIAFPSLPRHMIWRIPGL